MKYSENSQPIRESVEDSFDWFKSYSDLADIIHELIPDKSSKILMLGCGNSKLSEDVREVPSQIGTRQFIASISRCGKTGIIIS